MKGHGRLRSSGNGRRQVAEGEVRRDGKQDAKKLKQLEEENRKLKHVVAELTLGDRALKGWSESRSGAIPR
jgi:hypothetical protein